MAAKSIYDARFTMWATIVPRLVGPEETQPTTGKGKYVRSQDPDSFEITTTWVPDSQQTPGNTDAEYDTICYARGYTNLGYRSMSNTERYMGDKYEEVQAIQFDYPSSVLLNHQSLVTNIRGHQNDTDYIWLDNATGQPLVWEVQGITPVIDPFGKLIRNLAVLKRSDVQ